MTGPFLNSPGSKLLLLTRLQTGLLLLAEVVAAVVAAAVAALVMGGITRLGTVWRSLLEVGQVFILIIT